MTDTTIYLVEFERVGRRRDVEPLTVEATDGDDLAEKVHRYVDRFLGSRFYSVTIDGGEGRIEGGRFGTFTVREGERR